MHRGLKGTTRARTRQALAAVAGLTLAAGGLFVLAPGTATALTTITVGNSGDPVTGTAGNCAVATTCTFRDAFAAANATSGDSVINVTLPSSTTVNTTNGELDYLGGTTTTQSLTINGNGTTIQSGGTANTIHATTGTHLTINNITLKSGFTGASSSIPLTVTNTMIIVTVVTPAVVAQGIFGSGTVDVSNSTITATEGTGSTVSATGVIGTGNTTVTNSTVTATAAAGQDALGVEVFGPTGDAIVTGSTVVAVGANGAGVTGPANATIKNSTITGSGGWGIDVSDNVTLAYATVVSNGSAAQTGNIHGTNLISFGSIVALAGGGNPNCTLQGSTTSQGYNFTDDPSPALSCGLNNPTDHVGASNNAQLGALAANGGPTHTRLPASGSPVINAIPAAACQTGNAAGIVTDQRTLTRPANGACDIGAVEVQTAAIVGTPALTG